MSFVWTYVSKGLVRLPVICVSQTLTLSTYYFKKSFHKGTKDQIFSIYCTFILDEIVLSLNLGEWEWYRTLASYSCDLTFIKILGNLRSPSGSFLRVKVPGDVHIDRCTHFDKPKAQSEHGWHFFYLWTYCQMSRKTLCHVCLQPLHQSPDY